MFSTQEGCSWVLFKRTSEQECGYTAYLHGCHSADNSISWKSNVDIRYTRMTANWPNIFALLAETDCNEATDR